MYIKDLRSCLQSISLVIEEAEIHSHASWYSLLHCAVSKEGSQGSVFTLILTGLLHIRNSKEKYQIMN